MRCTHVALQVRDMARSIEFYQQYCGMRVVRDSTEESRVVWMSWEDDPQQFVLMLLGRPYAAGEPPPCQHIGIAVRDREYVDALYARATAEGISKVWPPTDGGPHIGYFCGIADPDGNMIAFSHRPELC